MKSIMNTLILCATLISCTSNKKSSTSISADLYYSWMKFGSFYGKPDSLLTNYLNLKDSLGYEGMMKEDSAGTAYFKKLEQYGLLSSPFVYLRAENGHTFLLLMNEHDYNSFDHFNYQELIDNKQKVKVEAEIDSLGEKMYLCKKIVSVKVVDGQTFQQQKKFKIEEYR